MADKPMLWNRKPDQVQSSLRPPKVAPNKVLNSSSHSNPHSETKVDINETVTEDNSNFSLEKNVTVEELVANSKLKVEAPEWFPSGHTYVPNNRIEKLASSVQNRLKINKTNESNDFEYATVLQNMEAIENSSDFWRLKQLINTLTKDPGQFDDLLELFLETLAPYFDDIIALSTIVKILLEQAINDANFRYTGARLCWYIEQNCPQFRAELHMGCKKQLEINSNTQNVLLFIAELFTQLPHHNVYGALLIDSFRNLFANGGDDNIKCICQALKLTGYTLEQSNKPDLDAVFDKLKSLKGTVRGSASTLLDTVFNLRSSNWGHSSDVSENDQEFDGFVYDGEQTTVFFNAEGEALTHEESEFIAAHMQSNDDILSDPSDLDELYDPEDEMDEEIQEAFREFVKFSSSKN
nr:polyadenylate-binding protein-interacting protein 1 [Leptinotarsa decemlineata]